MFHINDMSVTRAALADVWGLSPPATELNYIAMRQMAAHIFTKLTVSQRRVKRLSLHVRVHAHRKLCNATTGEQSLENERKLQTKMFTHRPERPRRGEGNGRG